MNMIDQETGEVVLPFVRSPYNYDNAKVSNETGLRCNDATRTQQQFKEEADINTIVKRFKITGEMPQDARLPESGDFTEAVTDYQTALNMVIEADREFMKFPANMRKRFDNDPQKMSAFLEDANNRDEAIELGLIKKPDAAPEPVQVRVISETGVPPAA